MIAMTMIACSLAFLGGENKITHKALSVVLWPVACWVFCTEEEEGNDSSQCLQREPQVPGTVFSAFSVHVPPWPVCSGLSIRSALSPTPQMDHAFPSEIFLLSFK